MKTVSSKWSILVSRASQYRESVLRMAKWSLGFGENAILGIEVIVEEGSGRQKYCV